MSGTAVSVRGLRKAYGAHEVVNGIDFEVGLGECFGFLGMNGAGKTTTIEILEGYRPRDGGQVTVLGVDPAKPTRAWRERIGLVLQEVELDPNLTVRETISEFASFYARPRPVDETIEIVGLEEKRGDRIGRLSGGQKRRVDVALGIIGDPDLIFLDEPTTGFDPAARRGAWTMIEGLKELGKTIFLTTHYMDEAQHLADRVCILRLGEIVAIGTPERLSADLEHSTVIGFRLPAGVTPDDVAAGAGLTISLAGTLASATTNTPQKDLYRLTGWAEQRAITLEEITVERPSLEDVFLELTADPGERRA